MKINGETLRTISVFPTMMTVPDCVVVGRALRTKSWTGGKGRDYVHKGAKGKGTCNV